MKQLRDFILWWAALKVIRRSKPQVIAVGGAIGKTSTKEAIGAVLNVAYPGQVTVGYGNLNTYIGVPLAILGFEIDFHQYSPTWDWSIILIRAVVRGFTRKVGKYLVLEYGTDRPGDIPLIVNMLAPDIAVLTVVGPAHLMNYSSERAIAEEEGALVAATKEGGVAFVNEYDQYVDDHKARAKSSVITVAAPLEEMSVIFAQAVAKYLKIDQQLTESALSKRVKPIHRFNTFKLKDFELLDDSYNANPLSMRAAFNLLAGMSGRKVAIIGSMLELGADELAMHREIGQLARQKADLIIAVGQLAQEYQADHWYATSEEASKAVLAYLKPGDSILVKGSRGIKMEKIVEVIKNA